MSKNNFNEWITEDKADMVNELFECMRKRDDSKWLNELSDAEVITIKHFTLSCMYHYGLEYAVFEEEKE